MGRKGEWEGKGRDYCKGPVFKGGKEGIGKRKERKRSGGTRKRESLKEKREAEKMSEYRKRINRERNGKEKW